MTKKQNIAVACLVLLVGFSVLWFLRPPEATGTVTWGVTFSHTFAEHLGLDWQEVYIAVLDDLGVRNMRIPVYWTSIEAEKGQIDFSDYDWMMSEAEKR